MRFLRDVLVVVTGVFVAGSAMNSFRNQKIVSNAISGYDK